MKLIVLGIEQQAYTLVAGTGNDSSQKWMKYLADAKEGRESLKAEKVYTKVNTDLPAGPVGTGVGATDRVDAAFCKLITLQVSPNAYNPSAKTT